MFYDQTKNSSFGETYSLETFHWMDFSSNDIQWYSSSAKLTRYTFINSSIRLHHTSKYLIGLTFQIKCFTSNTKLDSMLFDELFLSFNKLSILWFFSELLFVISCSQWPSSFNNRQNAPYVSFLTPRRCFFMVVIITVYHNKIQLSFQFVLHFNSFSECTTVI